MARFLLFASIVWCLGALNALRRPHNDRHPLRRPPWLFVMLTVELIPVRLIVWSLLFGVGAMFGAFDSGAGRVALWLTAATWSLYGVLLWRSSRAHGTVHAALDESEVPAAPQARIRWLPLLTANPYRLPSVVERGGDVEYARDQRLDVYRLRSPGSEPSPTLLQVHGGGWRGGNRRQQARPLLHAMALRGWISVSASYPLVPAATFPDQLIALKRAIVWLRTSGESLGVDPNRLFITGGSAGGHLAALTALTANRPEYQPGFEAANTSVQGAVTFYGIYDFLNRGNTRDPWPVIPNGVMKASPLEDESSFREASPIDQVHPDAPPFLVIHGSHDSLVSAAESQQFVAALRAVSTAPVAYAEIPGATHAFDVVPSLRTQHTVGGVARFLESLARLEPGRD